MRYDPDVPNVENCLKAKQVVDRARCFLPNNKRDAFLTLAAYKASGRKVSAGGGAAAIAGAW